MKFGVIIHTTTMNIGDDIQTYAAAKLLPRVDYFVNRETISEFESENNEPVAVVMNAWWMWKKWNWPPADCIIPKMTSMHINRYGIKKKSSPITNEWMTGCGKEYFQKYGPVGCRDKKSMKIFKKNGIDCYFSGCLTLTLPKQKTTDDVGTYICLVDINEKLEAKLREYLKDTKLEIRKFSHKCDYRKSNATIERRFEVVEELLTQYQNAKFVVTRRLHVTLPCIALGTPVLSVVDFDKKIANGDRWEPYMNIARCVDYKDFMSGNFEYDFINPPANKETYISIRDSLTKEIKDFAEEYENCDLPLEQVRKTSYTAEEKMKWQNEMMKKVLDKWLKQNREMLKGKPVFEETEGYNIFKRIYRKIRKDKEG